MRLKVKVSRFLTLVLALKGGNGVVLIGVLSQVIMCSWLKERAGPFRMTEHWL